MTKLTFGKTEARKIAKILDPGYGELDKDQQAEVEAIAASVLDEAVALVLDRAKFTVVGQLRKAPETRWTGPGEADASKGCLGFYSTAGEAQKAAEGLFYNSQTHEEWAAWVLPVSHATANDFHKARKIAKAEAAAAELAEQRANSNIAEWAAERAREVLDFIASLPEADQKRIKKTIGDAEWAAVEGMADRSIAA